MSAHGLMLIQIVLFYYRVNYAYFCILRCLHGQHQSTRNVEFCSEYGWGNSQVSCGGLFNTDCVSVAFIRSSELDKPRSCEFSWRCNVYFLNVSFYPGYLTQRSHPGSVREDENKQLELKATYSFSKLFVHLIYNSSTISKARKNSLR